MSMSAGAGLRAAKRLHALAATPKLEATSAAAIDRTAASLPLVRVKREIIKPCGAEDKAKLVKVIQEIFPIHPKHPVLGLLITALLPFARFGDLWVLLPGFSVLVTPFSRPFTSSPGIPELEQPVSARLNDLENGIGVAVDNAVRTLRIFSRTNSALKDRPLLAMMLEELEESLVVQRSLRSTGLVGNFSHALLGFVHQSLLYPTVGLVGEPVHVVACECLECPEGVTAVQSGIAATVLGKRFLQQHDPCFAAYRLREQGLPISRVARDPVINFDHDPFV
eukprot:CAMPEP_0177751744 /NCGR_PEP_ID=MMETSP0491_2-20121128/540_1 /TAXON_ID=63592 /ORGANISM="Tetraselmis chuii, Strain PLY429" /LENGTH=279 /DNA_ID=CAMNT_0019266883 /DNA_START=215 /DNA_END=1053 /DNA_ORIENTATION=+